MTKLTEKEVDKKVKGYLERAYQIILEDFDGKEDDAAKAQIEIAKMIQIEEKK